VKGALGGKGGRDLFQVSEKKSLREKRKAQYLRKGENKDSHFALRSRRGKSPSVREDGQQEERGEEERNAFHS